MKAIIIARVSTEEQKEAGLSLPAQAIRLENYCQNKGFTIIKTFSFDESAYKDDRTEFDRIFEYIMQQSDKVAICCDKVDRLSRNMFDKRVSLLYDKALRDEIELHFTSDGQVINSKISAAEKFHFGISLGLAKYYSDAISDNVKRAIEQKLRKGEWPSKAPYGYLNVTKPDGTTDIIVDEYAAGIVKKAFELYATSAYSMNLVCKKLLDDYGIVWSKGYMDHILKLPFYAGTMIWKEKLYQHKYPPLITQTLFEAVQQVKKNFNKKPVKLDGYPYKYRGLIRCADCDCTITPEIHKGLIYYHCTQFKGKHGAQWLREEEITNQLMAVFKRLYISKDIVAEIVQTLNEVHQDKIDFHNKHFDKLTKEHKQVTTMLDNLYLDKLKGSITESNYDKFYTSLRDQLTDISMQLRNLQEAEDNYYITSKHILDLANQAYELFIDSEVGKKRQLVKLIL